MPNLLVILFEDAQILAVVKPAGLLTQRNLKGERVRIWVHRQPNGHPGEKYQLELVWSPTMEDIFGAEHLNLAGGPLAKALEDLDGGRLAGAVRAEEGEDLPSRDLEVDACHSFECAVALSETTDAHHGVHGRDPSRVRP